MPQNPTEYTLSSSIMSTNFAPRSWGAMEALKGFRDTPMTVSWFEDFLVTYDLSRRQFCEIFGVGESTLSGWLNGKGIPGEYQFVLKMAEELDLVTERLERMAEALDAAQYDMRVVKDGDAYAIVEFPMAGNFGADLEDENRQPIGEIIARSVPTQETALSLVREMSLVRTLRKFRDEASKTGPVQTFFGLSYREEMDWQVRYQLGETPKVNREQSPVMKQISEMLMKGAADADASVDEV